MSVVKTQVLQKHRKALMLFGLGHLTHDGGSGAVAQLEREYPGAAYVVADHRGFTSDNARLEKNLGLRPSLIPLRGPRLRARSTRVCSRRTRTTRRGPAGTRACDASTG